MRHSHEYGATTTPLSGWQRYLLTLTLFLFCLPIMAFAQSPKILIEPDTVNFGVLDKTESLLKTATVLNYNPMPATITTGHAFSCALTSSGGANCWGFNNVGQLGNGTLTASSVPVVATGLTNATEIAAGRDHICALINDGTVQCWGGNGNGELGNGTLASKKNPTPVPGLSNAIAIT